MRGSSPLYQWVTIGFLVVVLVTARLLRHGGGRTLREPYECGNEPISLAHDYRFSIRYYLIAVLFVIFDVETVFLFPWAVSFGGLGWFGFWSMMIFLAILTIGFIYEWMKGALEWD